MAIDVFKGMNAEQQVAVGHIDGPLLVVAGAGSGKTRVITHRIAHLITAKNLRADRILAITFTNKAAGEMKERVHRLLGIATPWITTFHSAGLRILKQEAHRLGFSQPFTVMDEDEQGKLFKQVYKELKLDPKQAEPKRLLWRIGQWKNQLVDIAKVEPSDDEETLAQKCHAVYSAHCQKECKVDFDDLLVRPVRLFSEDESLRAQYQERFPYILVDEYQDTNEAQYRLLRLLGGHGNICATGDPDQAIYGWRGADIKNILNFQQDFPGCTVVKLEQNYRSTACILRAAQGVVANNTERMDKTIRTDNAEGKPLQLLAVDDEMDESYAISAAIERLHRAGRSLADFAIFYRTGAQSRILEDGLRRRSLPYKIVGGLRFYDRAEVKDLLSYCKILVNPADRTGLERIANVPRRGVGEKTFAILQELAEDEEVLLTDVLIRDDLLERIAVGRNANPLRDLARCYRVLRKVPKTDPSAVVRGIIEITKLEAHYQNAEEPAAGQERIANLHEVITAAEQYHEAVPDGGLAGFLDHVTLVTSGDDTRNQQTDQVTMMTLHAAKGLEFPVVFITGCEDGLLPLKRNGQVGNLEEERRLMYVGITRAMHELYLSRARCRMQYGQVFRNEMSGFLGEIPSTCFESKDATGRRELPDATARYGKSTVGGGGSPGTGSSGGRAAIAQARAAGLITSGAALRDADALRLKDEAWEPGMRVTHSTFGSGTVMSLAGGAENRAIRIAFDRVGEKELLLAFAAAKLSPA